MRATSAILLLVLTSCRTGHQAPATAPPPAPYSCGAAIEGEDQLTAPIVLIGEIHGTQETPATFGRLVCQEAARRRGEPIVVGLEIVASAQGGIDAFLASAGDAAATETLLAQDFWQREYQDGRSSQAMLGLLDALRRHRQAGLKIVVRALDPERYDEPGARDSGMAASLLDTIATEHPSKTLVLVGDVHSRTVHGYPWDPNAAYVPLGALLKEKVPDLLALDVANAGGTAWMCTSADAAGCGAKPLRVRETIGTIPRIVLDPAAAPTSGHNGALLIGPVTASPPARSLEP